MTMLVPVSVERLQAYLDACGGSDRFDFTDGFGEPDPLAARAFAEALRANLAEALDSAVLVQQHANRVTVSALPH
jgi:hypothetical protein